MGILVIFGFYSKFMLIGIDEYIFLIKWLVFSFDSGDDFSCKNHEFSSPGNSVSCPVTENPILLGKPFSYWKENWIYRHENSCLSHVKTVRNRKEGASHFSNRGFTWWDT